MGELRCRVFVLAASLNIRIAHVSLHRNFVVAHSLPICVICLHHSLRVS